MLRALVIALALAPIAFGGDAHARPGDRGEDRYQEERGRDRAESRDRAEDNRGRNRGSDDAREARDFVPLERVLRQIERRYPGHQLNVSGPSRSGGGYVYRIKWLTDGGAVLYIVADAESGAILSVDGG